MYHVGTTVGSIEQGRYQCGVCGWTSLCPLTMYVAVGAPLSGPTCRSDDLPIDQATGRAFCSFHHLCTCSPLCPRLYISVCRFGGNCQCLGQSVAGIPEPAS